MTIERNYSKTLLKALIDAMRNKVAGFTFSETQRWCGFYQKGGKRFAYILKSKTKPKIDIWSWGHTEELREKYGNVFHFRDRIETTGSFAKQFQVNFILDNLRNVETAAKLLTEISNSWSRDELLAAFNLYCKIPLNQINVSNTTLISFAQSLDRNIREITSRFLNFSKFDIVKETIENTSIKNESLLIREEFENDWNKSVLESESQLIKFENMERTQNFPVGKERNSNVKTRVNQNFFRLSVLSSYNNSCCISGLKIIELLNASHIVPWVIDEKNRLNPHNGLCLNALHDRAFDRGYITITPDFKIKISKTISLYADSKTVEKFFLQFQDSKINLPQRFLPEKAFLEFHNKNIFKR